MLRYDEENHAYWWEGQRVPSVTQILSSTRLMDFRMIPEHLRDYALERGSHVHKAIEYHNEGTLDWDSLDDAYRGYVEAYQAFLSDTNFKPAESELRGYCKTWRYAGTLDLIGTVPDGRTWIVDHKSGTVPDTAGMQTAAYEHLDNVAAKYPSVERYALQLSQDGQYRLSETFADPEDWANFQRAVGLYYGFYLKTGKVKLT